MLKLSFEFYFSWFITAFFFSRLNRKNTQPKFKHGKFRSISNPNPKRCTNENRHDEEPLGEVRRAVHRKLETNSEGSSKVSKLLF
jgi:hypothetical protein